MNATKTLERVERSATARKSDRKRSPEMSPGDHVRQGDVYLYKLAGLPSGVTRVDKPDAQLAPGSTQGSRHTLDSLGGVAVYRLPNPNALQGPVLDLAEPRTLTHPEHGHIDLSPGCYAVTYQRDHADELRAVRD